MDRLDLMDNPDQVDLWEVLVLQVALVHLDLLVNQVLQGHQVRLVQPDQRVMWDCKDQLGRRDHQVNLVHLDLTETLEIMGHLVFQAHLEQVVHLALKDLRV